MYAGEIYLKYLKAAQLTWVNCNFDIFFRMPSPCFENIRTASALVWDFYLFLKLYLSIV